MGVATSSADENKVAVAEDGSMEVNSLNMSKLVQSEGDTLVLDGGTATVSASSSFMGGRVYIPPYLYNNEEG